MSRNIYIILAVIFVGIFGCDQIKNPFPNNELPELETKPPVQNDDDNQVEPV